MTNKLVVVINCLKVPKIKKLLLYEMKFLVPNYSCLQNPWLEGHRPQIPVLCHLSSTEFVEPPPNKIPGYATGCDTYFYDINFYICWLLKKKNTKYKCPVYMSRSEAALSRRKSASPETSSDSCRAHSHSHSKWDSLYSHWAGGCVVYRSGLVVWQKRYIQKVKVKFTLEHATKAQKGE